MKNSILFFVVMSLAFSGVCFADAQNEAETKPRILTPTTFNMPVSQPMSKPIVTGWVAASTANTSCVTTCGIATPIVAFETTSGVFVATTAATADSCICNGPVA